MVGMAGSEVTTLGPKPETNKGAGVGKMAVWPARFGRTSKEPANPSSNREEGGMPILRFPRSHSGKTPHQRKTPTCQKWECKGRKGEKGKRGEKKGKSPEQTPPHGRFPTSAGSKYIGRGYGTNYHNRPKAQVKGKGAGY